MKTCPSVGAVLFVSLAFVVAGCGKKETSTASAPPSAPSSAPSSAPAAPAAGDASSVAATAEATVKESATNAVEQAKAAIADLKVPDLKSTSVSQLASTSSDALTNVATLAGTSQPEVAKQVEAVKSSLNSNKAVEALAQIKQLAATAQAIPGAQQAIDGAKQMVSAWALKQGFDTAKISPVLGALQSGDLTGLASQVSTLIGTGQLSDQQKTLLNGVLDTYGINAKASDLLGKMKLP